MMKFILLILGLQCIQIFSDDKETDNHLEKNGDTFKCNYFCETPSHDDNEFMPPAYNDSCTPDEILPVYITGPEEKSIQVTWTEPRAFDMNGTLLRNEQVIGSEKGSYFNGSIDGIVYNIVYIATDENGLKDSCHFNFTVYESMTCTSPKVIENGKYICANETTPGSTCKYKCNEGYSLVGDETITCLSNNQMAPIWSENPICKVVQCSVPTVPENGQVYCKSTALHYQTVCRTTCEKGFKAEGSLIMICQANGLWSRPTVCKNMKSDGNCTSYSCNGHRCLNDNGSYKCICSGGWSGNDCEENPNPCSDNACMNGGTCINKNKTYVCNCKANFGGFLCEAKSENGGWTLWSGWSKCSVLCGKGTKQRTRQCINPLPSNFGAQCDGDSSERISCDMENCTECPKLIEGKNTSLECKNDSDSELICTVHCQEGFTLVPSFDEFLNLTCGLKTGFRWMPANVVVNCVELVNPTSLRLDSSIEYLQPIPMKFYNSATEQVHEKLLSTDCFNSPTCKVNVTLQVHPSSNDAVEKTTLLISFENAIKGGARNNSTVKTANGVDVLMSKIKDMENTALTLAKNTSFIYDIRYNDDGPFKRSATIDAALHKAVVETLMIKGGVNCLPRQTPLGVFCIICPAGTYAGYDRCHLCIKGTFQPYEGQTRCTVCPGGLTTLSMGSFHESLCAFDNREVENVVSTPEEESKDHLGVTVSIVAVLEGIIGAIEIIVGLIIIMNKTLWKKGEEPDKNESTEENSKEGKKSCGETYCCPRASFCQMISKLRPKAGRRDKGGFDNIEEEEVEKTDKDDTKGEERGPIRDALRKMVSKWRQLSKKGHKNTDTDQYELEFENKGFSIKAKSHKDSSNSLCIIKDSTECSGETNA